MHRSSKSQLDRPTRLLKGRIQTLFRQLPGALAGRQEPVHQVRVAGRRLRVALPLLARKPHGKRVRAARRALRRLVRTAGTGRDLDVMLGLLEGRIRELDEPSPELLILRRRLRVARTRSRHKTAVAMLDLDIADLRRNLRRVVSRRAENAFTVLSRIREFRDEEGASLQSTLQELGDRFEPESLHDIRIRIRRLRYTAEIAAAAKQVESDAPNRFKQLQELLGRIQDAYVLARRLGVIAERADARGEGPVAAEARRQQEWFLDLSRTRHRELLDRDPLALLGSALEAMDWNRTSAA